MMAEVIQGRGIDDTILIDVSNLIKNRGVEKITTKDTLKRLFKELKAEERSLKASPVSHYCMGGVVINENCFTGIPGLYAAGEVVGGIHGANRHGGNALTEIFVFGTRAGAAAAKFASKVQNIEIGDKAKPEIRRYQNIMKGNQGFNPNHLMDLLKETMWKKAGVIRSNTSLNEALEKINDIRMKVERISIESGREMLTALEATLALDAAELIVRSALKRRESRGAHYRIDYPIENSKFDKPIFLYKK
jgi:succinate dehydrogenase/fumarate reductase flavoprotein subunit